MKRTDDFNTMACGYCLNYEADCECDSDDEKFVSMDEAREYNRKNYC